MDAGGIDIAVVSLTSPGTDHFYPIIGTGLAKRCNDALAEAIDTHPDRLMGFAALAPKNPEEAAKELERCVKELGFKGWKTHSNFGDSYIDEKRFWPILAKAEELDVPIYLHPVAPMIPQLRTYGLGSGRRSLRFRHGDGYGHDASGPERRVRCLPQTQDHPWPLWGGSALSDAAYRSSLRPAAHHGVRSRGRTRS